MKPRILLLADDAEWAVARENDGIEKHLSRFFDFTKTAINGVKNREEYISVRSINPADYALVFLKPHPIAPRFPQLHNEKTAIGIIGHHFMNPGMQRDILVSCLGWCKYYMVNNRDYIQPLTEMGARPENIFFVPSGVDPDIFRPGEESPNRKITIGWAGNPRHQGPAGNDHKGFKSIIQPLMQKFQELDWRFAKKIVSYNDMPRFYQSCDIILQASITESAGLTTLEGAACGCYIISTRTGYAPNFIVEGKGGSIVERSVLAFTQAIQEVISHPERLKIAQKLNPFLINNLFSVELLANHAETMFRKILAR